MYFAEPQEPLVFFLARKAEESRFARDIFRLGAFEIARASCPLDNAGSLQALREPANEVRGAFGLLFFHDHIDSHNAMSVPQGARYRNRLLLVCLLLRQSVLDHTPRDERDDEDADGVEGKGEWEKARGLYV